MVLSVKRELVELQRLTVGQLRQRYAEAFGEMTNARNKQWIIKKILWRLQSLAEGDLSERARARAKEIASDADIRRRPPHIVPVTVFGTVPSQPISRVPIPGTEITRQYKGKLLKVMVLENGFEYAGERYKSLSGLAKAITGSHCNGYQFFNLQRGKAHE
jgi:hypothetical protein